MAGCASDNSSAAPTAEPTASSTPVAAATLPPAPEPTAIACTDLISPADEKRYEAAGWGFSDDFVQRQTDQRSPLVAFVEYGGALCQWGYPQSDATDVIGGSALDETQVIEQQKRLEAEGYTLDEHNGAERYSNTYDVFESVYLFVDGYWFYGNSAATVDHARQNADVG